MHAAAPVRGAGHRRDDPAMGRLVGQLAERGRAGRLPGRGADRRSGAAGRDEVSGRLGLAVGAAPVRGGADPTGSTRAGSGGRGPAGAGDAGRRETGAQGQRVADQQRRQGSPVSCRPVPRGVAVVGAEAVDPPAGARPGRLRTPGCRCHAAPLAVLTETRSGRAPSGSAPGARSRSASNSGPVSAVVATAITTKQANTRPSMIPVVRPTLRMSSSVRPRQFISTPRTAPSRQDSPTALAAPPAATSLLSIAMANTARHRPMVAGPPITSRCVRLPMAVKNSGSSSHSVSPSAITVTRWAVSDVRGTTRPSRNAPKRSEEHTSELQSLAYLVCRLLL